jgi:hypothetical protein
VLYKILNLWRGQAPEGRKDKSTNIVKYGNDNDFPQRLTEAVYSSPTAQAALDILTKYIGGEGFTAEDIGKVVVGEKQTLAGLHGKLVEDFGCLCGIAVLVRYNSNGKPISYEHVPFENCRLELPDENGQVRHIHYNPFFGTSDFKKDKTVAYPVFDQMAAQEQINTLGADFKGQIFWAALTRINNRFYPVPQYYAAINDITADGRLTTFRDRLIDNGFFQSNLMTVIGDKDEKIQVGIDSEGKAIYKTREELFNEAMQENQGVEAAGSTMVFWVKSAEAAPKIEAFPSNYNDKLGDSVSTQLLLSIGRAFGVHPVLLGADLGSSLGQNNLLQNAIDMLQQRVSYYHSWLEQQYQKLFEGNALGIIPSEIKIKPLSYAFELPDKVWDALPVDAKYDWIEDNYGITVEVEVADPLADDPEQDSMPFNQVTDIAATYERFYRLFNMTYTELAKWLDTPCAKSLGSGRIYSDRVLQLLNLNKKDWGLVEARWAMQLLAKAEKIMQLKDMPAASGQCMPRKKLMLKNIGIV